MSKGKWTAVVGAVLLPLVLAFNGALPGIFAPTTAQVFWLTGFSQSFLNGASLYAHNFGLPHPAAISFGLAAALPISVFLWIGFGPAAAYSLVFACWLTVAYFGAFYFARKLGAGRWEALLSATVWCTLPIVWVHNIYSTLALGLALLPLYFYCAIVVCFEKYSLRNAAFLSLAAFLAAFMDGYTFMMFASGSCWLLLFVAWSERKNGLRHVATRASSFVVAFGASYLCYALYEGVAEFGVSSLNFFRGWGASLEFFFVPTSGILYVPDILGFSVSRDPSEFFGDASTYITTFSAAMIIVAIYGAASRRFRSKYIVLFGLIALSGFYMSLGPTVKLLTYRPVGASQLMPSSAGWFPTGNGILSGHVPGFENMRASYRWAGLGMFGCWAILNLILAGRSTLITRYALLAGLLFLNIPAPQQFASYAHFDEVIGDIDAEIAAWQHFFRPNETVAFLPYGNDFLVNYLASKLRIRTYNIGGDKNVVAAVQHWPDAMTEFEQGRVSPDFDLKVKALLESGSADAAVLSYISLLDAAHDWPSPDVRKAVLLPIAQRITDDHRYQAVFAKHFAIVRLSPGARPRGADAVLRDIPPISLVQPVNFGRIDPKFLYARGWYPTEPGGVWSKRRDATIRIDVAEAPPARRIRLTFHPYLPKGNCETVRIGSGQNVILQKKFCGEQSMQTVDFTSKAIGAGGEVHFSVDRLRSPSEFGSADARKIGIFLSSIETVPQVVQ